MEKKKVRAVFVCDGEQGDGDNSKTVHFSAVTGNSEKNSDFAKYTPSGQLEITISNETNAYSFFEEGKEYNLDFTEA